MANLQVDIQLKQDCNTDTITFRDITSNYHAVTAPNGYNVVDMINSVNTSLTRAGVTVTTLKLTTNDGTVYGPKILGWLPTTATKIFELDIEDFDPTKVAFTDGCFELQYKVYWGRERTAVTQTEPSPCTAIRHGGIAATPDTPNSVFGFPCTLPNTIVLVGNWTDTGTYYCSYKVGDKLKITGDQEATNNGTIKVITAIEYNLPGDRTFLQVTGSMVTNNVASVPGSVNVYINRPGSIEANTEYIVHSTGSGNANLVLYKGLQYRHGETFTGGPVNPLVFADPVVFTDSGFVTFGTAKVARKVSTAEDRIMFWCGTRKCIRDNMKKYINQECKKDSEALKMLTQFDTELTAVMATFVDDMADCGCVGVEDLQKICEQTFKKCC